jgi:hypothetical protein
MSGEGNKRLRLNEKELEVIRCLRETGSVPASEMVQYDRNISSLSEKYQSIRKKYKQLMKEADAKDVSIAALCDMEDNRKIRIKPQVKKPRTGKARHSKSWAFAIASDWHAGEYVNPDTVNDLNSFDLDVFQKRAKLFFERALYLTNLVRAGTDVDVFVLTLLGDFIAGEIHDEIKEEALGSATEMIALVSDVLCDGIDFLQKEGKFQDILIPCSFGNHARNTKETRSSTAWKTSYEYLMYSFLQKMYMKNEHVHFQLSKGYHNYFTAFDKYKLRLHHGDAIRYAGGVGGITIPVNKAVAQWNKNPSGRNTYLDIFGHYHQSKSDNCWISNGSLVGYNAYALKLKADYEPPRQQFFTIEKDHGLTFPSYIFLDD